MTGSQHRRTCRGIRQHGPFGQGAIEHRRTLPGYPAGSSALNANVPALRTLPVDVAVTATVARTEPPALISGAAGAAPASGGPDQATLNAAIGSTDWLVHNHDYSGTRHSPLDQITPVNASRLVPACVFQVGEPDNFQTNPIVHNGTMYLTTRRSTVALDAANCREKWRYSWDVKVFVSLSLSLSLGGIVAPERAMVG